MTRVYLEVAEKRVFVCALDWPGWCRSGRDEQRALDALAGVAPRYALVVAAAGLRFPSTAARDLEVVERLPGSMTTQFGAPGAIASSDADPLQPTAAGSLAALVEASWNAFDAGVAAAPALLRKGPRGGGRDRDQIVEHVLAAEVAYARKLGLRHKPPSIHDTAAVQAQRAAILAALRGSPAERPESAWPPRYAARRIAWHVLDHLWEIEDRSQPSAGA